MNLIQTTILAITEGLTEFLPISSTGHMILVGHLLHIVDTDFIKSFEIIIQFGAILAVVLLYFKYLLKNRGLWLKIIVAFLPTAFVGLVLYKFIKGFLLGNILVTVISLFVGGFILLIFERFYSRKVTENKSIAQLTLFECAVIGTIQSVSIIPGVSRAAATIVGGLMSGLDRKDAVKFSFFLAIPTMAAATGLDLLKSAHNFSSYEMGTLLLGLVVSFITAYIVIKYFVKFIQNHTFVPFAIYRIVFAVIYFLIFIR